MFNSNDFVISKLAEHREAELREKARIARLLADTRLEKTGFRARLLPKIGQVLILLGQNLKARYEPEPKIHLTRSHPSLE